MIEIHQTHPYPIDQLKQPVLAAAESLAPAIALDGSALVGPQILELDPQEYADGLDVRLRVEHAIAVNCRKHDIDLGSWTFSAGLYLKYTERDYQAPLGEQPLGLRESKLSEHILRCLETAADKPTIALDFGGGLGLSWMRIAMQPQFQEAIARGDLIMAVTNLGCVPNPAPDSNGLTGVARSMDASDHETVEWIQENQKNVRYLDANGLELLDIAASLPDGTSAPFLGGIHLIHEDFALRHTHVPDLVMASFRQLLAPEGILYSDAAQRYHIMNREQFSDIRMENGENFGVTPEYTYQRRLALAVGSRMLQMDGFSHTEQMDLGVFSQGAPKAS